MAKLLGSHSLDCCRFCLVCTRLTEARYNGAYITETDDGTIVEGRLYTCLAEWCGSTYTTDLEPRPSKTVDDIGEVVDSREWARPRRNLEPSRYALVGDMVP